MERKDMGKAPQSNIDKSNERSPQEKNFLIRSVNGSIKNLRENSLSQENKFSIWISLQRITLVLIYTLSGVLLHIPPSV